MNYVETDLLPDETLREYGRRVRVKRATLRPQHMRPLLALLPLLAILVSLIATSTASARVAVVRGDSEASQAIPRHVMKRARRAVRFAGRAWHRRLGRVCPNGVTVVAEQLPVGTLAAAGRYREPGRVWCPLSINMAQLPHGRGQWAYIITHEVGHVLGKSHTQVRTDVMYERGPWFSRIPGAPPWSLGVDQYPRATDLPR